MRKPKPIVWRGVRATVVDAICIRVRLPQSQSRGSPQRLYQTAAWLEQMAGWLRHKADCDYERLKKRFPDMDCPR